MSLGGRGKHACLPTGPEGNGDMDMLNFETVQPPATLATSP